jgi:hypothetical protein
MAGKGRLSEKGKINRGQLRELFTEQMMRAIETRGFVDYLFKNLDEIKDPKDRVRCGVELLKFVMPQLAAQKIEVEQVGGQVERVVFRPIESPKIESKEA